MKFIVHLQLDEFRQIPKRCVPNAPDIIIIQEPVLCTCCACAKWKEKLNTSIIIWKISVISVLSRNSIPCNYIIYSQIDKVWCVLEEIIRNVRDLVNRQLPVNMVKQKIDI